MESKIFKTIHSKTNNNKSVEGYKKFNCLSFTVYNIQHSVIQTGRVQHNRNNQLREICPVHQLIIHRGAGGGGGGGHQQ